MRLVLLFCCSAKPPRLDMIICRTSGSHESLTSGPIIFNNQRILFIFKFDYEVRLWKNRSQIINVLLIYYDHIHEIRFQNWKEMTSLLIYSAIHFTRIHCVWWIISNRTTDWYEYEFIGSSIYFISILHEFNSYMIFRQSNSPIITHIQVSIVKCKGVNYWGYIIMKHILLIYYYDHSNVKMCLCFVF